MKKIGLVVFICIVWTSAVFAGDVKGSISVKKNSGYLLVSAYRGAG